MRRIRRKVGEVGDVGGGVGIVPSESVAASDRRKEEDSRPWSGGLGGAGVEEGGGAF